MFLIYQSVYISRKLPEQLVIAAVSDLFVSSGLLVMEEFTNKQETRVFLFSCPQVNVHCETFTIIRYFINNSLL